jgi:hypothetical protein
MKIIQTENGKIDVTNWRKYDWSGLPALVPPEDQSGNPVYPDAIIFDTNPPRTKNVVEVLYGGDSQPLTDQAWDDLKRYKDSKPKFF